MTAEQFAHEYGLRLEQVDLAPGFLAPVPSIAGMNGGINIFGPDKPFEVVVVSVGWLERWRIKRALAGVGMQIKKRSGPEYSGPGARIKAIVATFDPEDSRQATLAISMAWIPSVRPPDHFGHYLFASGWRCGVPPVHVGNREQEWQDPISPRGWHSWRNAVEIQQKRDEGNRKWK